MDEDEDNIVESEWEDRGFGINIGLNQSQAETTLVSALRPLGLGIETSRSRPWDPAAVSTLRPSRGLGLSLETQSQVSTWDCAGLNLRPLIGPRTENPRAVESVERLAAMAPSAPRAGTTTMAAAATPAFFFINEEKTTFRVVFIRAKIWACHFIKNLVFFKTILKSYHFENCSRKFVIFEINFSELIFLKNSFENLIFLKYNFLKLIFFETYFKKLEFLKILIWKMTILKYQILNKAQHTHEALWRKRSSLFRNWQDKIKLIL